MLAGEPYAGAGVVRVEDIGPVILDQVHQWLDHSNVVLKPVINLAGVQPVDHYETPPAISEAIGLIRSADSWPFGTCMSRHQDNEHTEPFVPMNRGGPPGQTDPLKMSKMTRGHHRIKTHAGWTVTQAQTRRLALPLTPRATTSSSTNTAPPHSEGCARAAVTWAGSPRCLRRADRTDGSLVRDLRDRSAATPVC